MVLDTVKQAFLALIPEKEIPAAPEEEVAAEAPEEAAAEEGAEAPKKKAKEEEKEEFRPVVLATDYKSRGAHLDVEVPPDLIVEAVKVLDKEGFFLETITGVDWLADGEFEAVYDFNNMSELCRVVLRVRVPRDNPQIDTISKIFSGADWHERETHDFFGIEFVGHPDLSPLLLPEDADFHPLRKDYTP